MLLKALLGIASVLLLTISLQAQSESTSSPSPLQVTVKPTGQQKQFVSPLTNQSISVPELSFDIRNVSQKCVVGISVRTEDKDSEGKVMATGGATFFRQHDGKLNCLEPGQTFRELDRANSLDKYGNPSAKEDVTVDFVLFSDGSTWGPGSDLEQKGYLRGKFDAYRHIQKQNSNQDCSSHADDSRATQSSIERLEIVGYRHVQRTTILAHIHSRPGDTYNEEAVQHDAQALRDSGYFDEVRVRVEDSPDQPNGKIVAFDVKERPVSHGALPRRSSYLSHWGCLIFPLRTTGISDLVAHSIGWAVRSRRV